jgi:DNA-binding CsgD family transcriptional regulator
MSVRISDFIEASNAATTFDGLGACYADAIASYGYDRYMYAMMSYDPAQEWHDVPSIMRNYPEDWMKFYIENGYVAIDPLRQVAFRARGPVLWDNVPELIELSSEQRSCLFQGTEAGLFNGIGVPFHGPCGEVAGVGIASSERSIDLHPNVVSALALISQQFHTAYIHMALGALGTPKVQLTQREREILLWCSRGKSNWVIGEILGISEHAVKFHVANCIAKLGTDSRITAVLKAIRLGLISP